MRQQKANVQPLPIFTTPIHTLIRLERASETPLYRQISQSLREAIISGELPTGTRLPTERALARELGVNRTTVMNAYNELASEGLIEGHVGRGTLVKRNYFGLEDDYFEEETPSWLFGLAAGEDTLLGPDARMMTEISAMNEQRSVISLAQATPSNDLLPSELVRTIVDEGLRREPQGASLSSSERGGQAQETFAQISTMGSAYTNNPYASIAAALGYCPVEGSLALRRGIAERMRRRGMAVDVQNILILSGSTQGIGLIARFLLNPGDEVVVEVPTYLGAIQTFRALGARVIGVPTDNDGMRVDLLESILTRRQPRFIYTLPTFQNPTGSVLSPERRRRLLLLARRHQIPILEDDPYSELYFEEDTAGKIPQPLKTLDTHQNVLYLSTFSKMLAPGLRVAWLAAPEPVIERLSLHKQIFDLNTNGLGQWIVSEFIRRGMLDGYLADMRDMYRRKRDVMLEAIKEYWPAGARVNRPQGGFHLWCRLPGEMRARTLLREAANEQVAFVIGEPFHVDGGGHHYIRLSYSSADEEHIVEGIRRIGNAMRRLLRRRGTPERSEQSHIERLPMV